MPSKLKTYEIDIRSEKTTPINKENRFGPLILGIGVCLRTSLDIYLPNMATGEYLGWIYRNVKSISINRAKNLNSGKRIVISAVKNIINATTLVTLLSSFAGYCIAFPIRLEEVIYQILL